MVAKARGRADETLASARADAEKKLDAAGASPDEHTRATREHPAEDATIQAERDTADALLAAERKESKRALNALLHLEREQTDKHLYIERGHSDQAVGKRDDFLGMVSHDLRTILGGIALSAERLINTATPDEPGAKTLKIAEGIQRYSARMNRLIGDLVDVTSIETGELPVTTGKHDAVKLVRDTLEAFRPLASAKQLSLDAKMEDAVLLAKFDPDRILQVAGNLVANAVKFTPAGGRILVAAERVGQHVQISVSDTGVGIPADKREAIFERFWQAKQSTARDGRGLGLGLFIAKQIVEAHGGRIWAEAGTLGGSTLRFTLPSVSAP